MTYQEQQVERVMYPGQGTTMLGLLKYPFGFQLADGLKQMWYKDTSNATGNSGFNVRRDHLFADTTSIGAFSFRIPLKHIFGFCETYDKVVYGFRHTITFTKKEYDDAIYRAGTVTAGMIDIKKFRLFMPRIELDVLKKSEFLNLYGKENLQFQWLTKQTKSKGKSFQLVSQNSLGPLEESRTKAFRDISCLVFRQTEVPVKPQIQPCSIIVTSAIFS
jgi:hypothetical protein